MINQQWRLSFVLVLAVVAFSCHLVLTSAETTKTSSLDLILERFHLKSRPKTNEQKAYKTIEKFLNENIQTDSVADNLVKAKEMLDDKKQWTPDDRQAIEQFVRLEQLNGEGLCEPQSSMIIINNLGAIDCLKTLKNPKRRVDKVIGHFVTRHALECIPLQEERYKQQMSLMANDNNQRSASSIEAVEMMAESLISSHASSTRRRRIDHSYLLDGDLRAYPIESLVFVHELMNNFGVAQDTKIVLWLIHKMAESNMKQEDTFEIHPDKLGRLSKLELMRSIEQYWRQPCAQFVDLFEPVYRPLEVELIVMYPVTPWQVRNQNDREFFKSWAEFRLCQKLLIFGLVQLAERVLASGSQFVTD